jgi:AcrR family transcriptional regulator
MARRSDHSHEEISRMALDAAARIVGRDGLRALTTRRIAAEIGYSAGTLYRLFRDLDDLIVQLNVRTLDSLYAACRTADVSSGQEQALQALAACYVAYVGQNPKLWDAVLGHRMPEGAERPAEFDAATARIFALANQALASIGVPKGSDGEHDARVLWAALYGITSLAASTKLGPRETLSGMVRSIGELCRRIQSEKGASEAGAGEAEPTGVRE